MTICMCSKCISIAIAICYFTSPAYQFEVLPPVEEAIRQLHATVNNADTEGYSIVYGVGATNILFMTITAMSRNILNVSS